MVVETLDSFAGLEFLLDQISKIDVNVQHIMETLKWTERRRCGLLNASVFNIPFNINKHYNDPSCKTAYVNVTSNKSILDVWWDAVLNPTQHGCNVLLIEEIQQFMQRTLGYETYSTVIQEVQHAFSQEEDCLPTLRCERYNINGNKFLHVHDFIMNEFIKAKFPFISTWQERDSGEMSIIMRMNSETEIDQMLKYIISFLNHVNITPLNVSSIDIMKLPNQLHEIVDMLIPGDVNNMYIQSWVHNNIISTTLLKEYAKLSNPNTLTIGYPPKAAFMALLN